MLDNGNQALLLCYVESIVDENGFRVGFNFSGDFYYEKLKEVFRIRNKFIYNKKKHLLSVQSA